ncbi:hypothetical protein G432_14460 [Sphingomonas sp. MM-1]|uniref:alpha/beta fold hydrolase n=1 Tax=Sphingomonas sp. MM-1 TaxID=745310 RepID=UPI0002C10C8C|nr:alpha/beta hydrolase [Sphingomonas sp. MM-1]AGH50611.1 hypothetical protein G432_14460 [Sphingomonas sp. MM-1]
MPDPMSPPSDYPAVADATIPPLGRFLAEGSALVTWPFTARTARRIAAARRGDGRAVMVIPGFLAGDPMTSRLRRMLRIAGYAPHGWGLGFNRGVTADLLARMQGRLEHVARADAGPISLVGWSLGGLYAREMAKLRPDLIDRVITLGSPFSGDPRANRAWRRYEALNGHPVDRLPIPVDLPAKPPVRTFALWSAQDGIVAPATTHGQPGEADHVMRVACRHIDFVTAPAALAAILDALEA